MRIGFIGGDVDKEVISPHYDRHKPLALEWTRYIKVNDGVNISNSAFQRTITFSNPQYDLYKLILLKRNGEMKYFYVYAEFKIEQLRGVLDDYWNLSDIAGYDLD